MKLNYKDKLKKHFLYGYYQKLKSLDIEKFPLTRAMRNYFKKAKIIVYISLFFVLHGVGIIEESILKLGSYEGFNVWLGVSSKITSDMGFVIGVLLIVTAIGLVNKKKNFYYSAMVIVFSFMIYLSISLVGLKDMYVASEDFSTAFFMVVYLGIYGAVFGNLMTLVHEMK